MRYAAPVLVALLLVATCCGQPVGGEDRVVLVVAVPYGPHGKVAWTEFGNGRESRVEVDGRDEVRVYRDSAFHVAVMVHELWHAVGHSEHLEPPCRASVQSMVAPYGWPACAEELAAMSRVEGVWTVRAMEGWLRVASEGAAAFWNGALGRELFRVE